MSTVVIRTDAGAALELDALNNGAAMPRIAKLAFSDSTPVTDPMAIKAMTTLGSITHEILRTTPDALLFDSVSSVTTKINAYIPPSVEAVIKCVGVFLEDGTLWGYAPYKPANGGLNKTTDFSVVIVLTITMSDSDITINYSPYDTATILANLEAKAAEIVCDCDPSIVTLAATQLDILTRQFIHINSPHSGGASSAVVTLAPLTQAQSDYAYSPSGSSEAIPGVDTNSDPLTQAQSDYAYNPS